MECSMKKKYEGEDKKNHNYIILNDCRLKINICIYITKKDKNKALLKVNKFFVHRKLAIKFHFDISLNNIYLHKIVF